MAQAGQDGRVVGAWRRTLTPHDVAVTLEYWTSMAPAARRAVATAAQRYAGFLERRLSLH